MKAVIKTVEHSLEELAEQMLRKYTAIEDGTTTRTIERTSLANLAYEYGELYGALITFRTWEQQRDVRHQPTNPAGE